MFHTHSERAWPRSIKYIIMSFYHRYGNSFVLSTFTFKLMYLKLDEWSEVLNKKKER